MATPTANHAPRFSTSSHHAGLRATVIFVLWAALAGGFLAQYLHAPAPAASADLHAATAPVEPFAG